VIVSQERGYAKGMREPILPGHPRDITIGKRAWTAFFSPVHEALLYAITDATQFDPGTQLNFQVPYQRKWDVEPSFNAQDQMRLGRWNLSAGLRFDHYGFGCTSRPGVRESAYRDSSRGSICCFMLLTIVFFNPRRRESALASSPLLDAISRQWCDCR